MRIHTNKLVAENITAMVEALLPGCRVHNLREHRSRSRVRAFELNMSGHGTTGGQWGSAGLKTATWDEWGILINALYDLDPTAHWGKNSYQCAEHFHWATANRYKTLKIEDQHRRHRWEAQGLSPMRTYWIGECNCGAVLRRLHEMSWDNFQEVTA